MSGYAAQTIVVTPNEADGKLSVELLRADGIVATRYPTLADVPPLAGDDIGCLLIVEEALTQAEIQRIDQLLLAQPAWSDLPLLVIAGHATSLVGFVERVFSQPGNLSVLQRPLHPVTLSLAVKASLRARARQFELRDLLAERTNALRRRDEFIAMLAHELRNPLAPIRSAVEALSFLKPLPQRVQQAVDVIDRQSRHFGRLVEDLLEASRVTQGKIELRKGRCVMQELVQHAVETVRPALQAGGQQLSVAMPDEPLDAIVDSARVTQVIVNLLSNAVKFTPRGRRIDLALRREDSRAVISVRDDGIGIPAEHLDDIFDLFSQVVPAMGGGGGGLGIGLALARGLVELHGGTIEAHSDGPARGAEFVVRVPTGTPASDARSTGAEAATRLSGQKVLVVDDNVDAADALALSLELAGADVRITHSGPEALEVLSDYDADLALVDIGMPDINGYELARLIRQRFPQRAPVLAALTGWGQDEDRQAAFSAGFDHHLVKPANFDALRALLASVGATTGRSSAH